MDMREMRTLLDQINHQHIVITLSEQKTSKWHEFLGSLLEIWYQN